MKFVSLSRKLSGFHGWPFKTPGVYNVSWCNLKKYSPLYVGLGCLITTIDIFQESLGSALCFSCNVNVMSALTNSCATSQTFANFLH